jgi:hypothetical protein
VAFTLCSLFGFYPEVVACQYGVIVMTSYGLVNSLLTIFFVAPFRRHLFGCLEKGLVALGIRADVVKMETSDYASGNGQMNSLTVQQRNVITRRLTIF